MNNAMTYIIAGAIFDTFGDLLMKNWVLNSSKSYFLCGMVFYIIGLSFLAYSFTLKNLIAASVLFLVLNVILLALINCFYYNESLAGKEILAIGFGLIAIILFEF